MYIQQYTDSEASAILVWFFLLPTVPAQIERRRSNFRPRFFGTT